MDGKLPLHNSRERSGVRRNASEGFGAQHGYGIHAQEIRFGTARARIDGLRAAFLLPTHETTGDGQGSRLADHARLP